MALGHPLGATGEHQRFSKLQGSLAVSLWGSRFAFSYHLVLNFNVLFFRCPMHGNAFARDEETWKGLPIWNCDHVYWYCLYSPAEAHFIKL